MTPTIITSKLPRLKKGIGIQITATIRPDLNDDYNERALRDKIKKLIEGGTSHFRLNLSHYKPDDPEQRKGLARDEYEFRWSNLVQCIDSVRDQIGVNVFIMLDTAGPEFRIGGTSSGKRPLRVLKEGAKYILSGEKSSENPSSPTIYVSMPPGFRSFGEHVVGRKISFKDGDCTAIIIDQASPKLITIEPLHRLEFRAGNNIKVNFPGFDLHGITSLGPFDRNHIEFFLNIPKLLGSPQAATSSAATLVPVHYIAQSFVREAQDINALKHNLDNIDGIIRGVIRQPLIIPKIETEQAVDPQTLKEIAKNDNTAAVMVARGDLGTELERWLVPSKQREIIRVAHSYLKPVLVATEVYGSMGKHPKEAWQPNRGEVLDLRHALEAGVDGIVFSAETGARDDPERTLEFAGAQANWDEKDIEELDLHKAERDSRRERMEFGYDKILDRPIRTAKFSEPPPLDTLADYSTMDWACAAVYRANIRGAAGIFPFTVTGNTVRDMVHFLPYRPIVALTDNKETLARLALFSHVHPVLVEAVDEEKFDVEDLKKLVRAAIEKFDMRKFGKEALATMPHPVGKAGGTDTLVRILLEKR